MITLNKKRLRRRKKMLKDDVKSAKDVEDREGGGADTVARDQS